MFSRIRPFRLPDIQTLSAYQQCNMAASLWNELPKGNVWRVMIEDPEGFLRIRWLRQPVTDVLTGGRTLPLREVVAILGTRQYRELGVWFAQCEEIDKAFSFDRMGLLAIHPSRESACAPQPDPDGDYELFEGQHTSLVVARRIMSGLPWQDIDALVLHPRRRV